MTIRTHTQVTYYSLPIPTVETDDLLIVTGLGEDEDGNDVITLAVTAGPVQFEIALSREDAANLADDLRGQAHDDEGGAS
ncbi:hypothetical protein [Rhodococcus aetherivorans]|uniref:hypothetical protein n=1 Tax=Rhodococcus aetherivorans TaxID=191292 RepID=UPI00045D4077|nr:hypothetical protein [Rhodococcus aetherivorans]KDE14220.1 hypothetical protein N505_0105180 [Rhodococcus aetherivorans]